MNTLKKGLFLKNAQRETLLHQIERITELPLLVLSFAMIPLLVGPMLWELSTSEEMIFQSLNALIWAIFAVDLAVKVAIAPYRWD